MRVVGYIRVSRVAGREGASFISPAVQRERIASSGHEVVEWIEDLDQPGSRRDRPGLMRAMELVRSGKAEGICVAKLDRFGRSIVHQGQLVAELREAGGALLTVAEGIDTRGHTGNLVANILGAIAEWELDRIRENWAAARAAASERGAYLAEAPVGFTKDSGGRLEPVPPVLRAVGQVIRRRGGGDSWVTLARWLDSEGIPSRRGGNWTVASVRNLVANRTYVEQGVVTEVEWRAANESRGVAPARSGRASGLLSGILRCAGCRYAMKLSQGRTRHGKDFTEYRCKSSRGEAAGGRCEAPASITSTVIEGYVMEEFWRIVGDYALTQEAAVADVEEMRRQRRAAEQERDAALDTSLAEALGGAKAERYVALVADKQAAVDVAVAAELEAERGASTASLASTNLRELWPDLPLYDQRKLLASVFDCVFVRRGSDVGERTFICRVGEAPTLPVKGRRWTIEPFDFPGATKAIR
jgi:DNA invertase Pin-like site-specific DNA recombinase